MPTADPHPAEKERDPERSVFLSDGVVAIAVTLLALDLKPDLPAHASSGQLAHYLHTHGSQYLSFVLAFWLIARFWLLHHRAMSQVRALDNASTWVNLLFLFGVTCLPVTTYVNGTFSSSLATTLFASTLVLISVSLALLTELTFTRNLVRVPETPVQRVWRRWQMVGNIAGPLIVIAAAWVLRRAELLFLLGLLADVPARIAVRRYRRSDEQSDASPA